MVTTKLPVSANILWERHVMALEEVTQRMNRITCAFDNYKVPYALVGGQAVAVWVASKEPGLVRTTKDVDLLLDRRDLEQAKQAAGTIDMEYHFVNGIGMFLERQNPSPRHGVHLVWAGELIRDGDPVNAPPISEAERVPPGMAVISLKALVTMKLLANRDHDRTHLRDMIGAGLITRSIVSDLPSQLTPRLEALLDEMGVT